MFDSVRTRLTLWYAGVLALSLIAVGTAEIATSARGALDELWRLSRVTEVTTPEPSERSYAREIAEGEQAG